MSKEKGELFPKLVLAVFIIGIVVLFFSFDLHERLTLSEINNNMDSFKAMLETSPITVGATFFAVYVSVTALSLPGASIMGLAAGALFGLFWGAIIVSFASSIGALLAFLVSRYLLQDFVQRKFSNQLKTVNDGIEKEGAFYLFTLRLVPLFPFFLINIVMGLTPLGALTFYWVSQVGMFAGTLVFVNAGTQLATIESTSGIFSPALLFSFALLGALPLVSKRVIDFIKQQKVYKQWDKPSSFDRNLIVIGAGAGGLVSAYIASAVKAKVTLVESGKMGGDCLNYGCVPSKALIRSAKLHHQINHSHHYGLQASTASYKFKDLMARINAIIKEIEPHDSVERYTQLGVDVLSGKAVITDPWTVDVLLSDGSRQTLTSKNIIIATGARPCVPNIEGIENSGYLTSETLWEAFSKRENITKKIVILGGGPVGCELAQSFSRLGAKVTIIQSASRLMRREDADVSDFVKETLQKENVNVLLDHRAVRFYIDNQRHVVAIECDNNDMHIEYDALICATGRHPRTEGFGLEELDLIPQGATKTIETNAFLQTRYPNIFAVGDVAGPYQLTHAAAHQAWYACVNSLFGRFKKFKVDYRVLPWVTFVDPEVARVGINEQEALKQGIPYALTRYDINDLDRAITESSNTGFVKILTVPGKDKILGVTIVGHNAGETLAEFVLAMKHGLGLNKILATIHSYPTWAEANKYAAGEWKKAHTSEKILGFLKRFHAWGRS